MAKDNNKNSIATTISSRLDILAKNIINRSGKTYREILEKNAYTSIKDGLDDITFISDEKIEKMEEELSDLRLLVKENNEDIEHYTKQIQIRSKRNERLEIKIEELEENLKEVQDAKEYLYNVIENYSDQIVYSVDKAVAEVESVLRHNDELRNYGPRPRVQEKEIKTICKKHKVAINEVIPKVDEQYLDCLENYEKYL